MVKKNRGATFARRTLPALRSIGATQTAALLERASAVLGLDLTDDQPVEMHLLFRALSENGEQQLSAMDREYYASNERINVLLPLFVVRHRQHFTR